jgi:acyl carrier protein
MVPSAITVLASWPLTTNGKLDRAALPEPGQGEAAADFTAPRTTTEEILAEIWRDVLQVPRVGAHDNFFELGGHSLLATQVIMRVHEALGTDVSLAQFFAAPTVARLASVVEQALIEEIKATSDSATEPTEGAGLALARE